MRPRGIAPSTLTGKRVCSALLITVCAALTLHAVYLYAIGGLVFGAESIFARRRHAAFSVSDDLTSTALKLAAEQHGAVIIVVGNRAMNDMMENWVISADAVRPRLRYLLLPLDEVGYNDLRRRKLDNVVRDTAAWAQFFADGSSFGGRGYRAMSMYKWRATHALLKAGVDVLMSDPDIVILRNPLPYIVSDLCMRPTLYMRALAYRCNTLSSQATMPRCDLYTQLDSGADMTGQWVRKNGGYGDGHMYTNTGFVYFRSTPAIIRALDMFLDYVEEMSAAGRVVDDQAHWNECV